MQRKRRTNRYAEMSGRHQKEFNDFPKVFAFNQEDALKKLGTFAFTCRRGLKGEHFISITRIFAVYA